MPTRIGTLRLLEAIRILGLEKKTRFYQASTSETVTAWCQETPQTRNHALLSALALWRSQALRLLDHRELPRSLRHVRLQRHPVQSRDPRSAAKPSSRARSRAPLARIKLGTSGQALSRQPGFASATGAMPRDYVEAHVADAAAGQAGRFRAGHRRSVFGARLRFHRGGGSRHHHPLGWHRRLNEKGYDAATGKCLVEVDPRYFRPAEVETLLGDPTKAKTEAGLGPKTSFAELVSEMMREALRLAQRDELVKSTVSSTPTGSNKAKFNRLEFQFGNSALRLVVMRLTKARGKSAKRRQGRQHLLPWVL